MCRDGVRLAPSPDREAKVLPTIQRALAEDCLEPEVELPSETLFGQSGASALKPIHARAARGHEFQGGASVHLNTTLRCSLKALARQLRDCRPKRSLSTAALNLMLCSTLTHSLSWAMHHSGSRTSHHQHGMLVPAVSFARVGVSW